MQGLSHWMRATLLAVGMVVALAGQAAAAVLPLSLEQMVAVSDQIVTVRVKGTETKSLGRQLATTARFDVLDTMKGNMKGEGEISYLGGQRGMLVMDVPNSPNLQPDQEVILFLSRPFDRLPEAMKKNYNASSPLVSGYSVVGAWQGKLEIVDEDGTPNTLKRGRKGAVPVPGSARVVRAKSFTHGDKSASAAPTYDELRAAIVEVVSANKMKLQSKGPKDEIKGIYGRFAVPEKSASKAIRFFDPLPELAYKSDEELKAINEQVKKDVEAAKARQAAAQSTKPANVSTTSDNSGNGDK